MATGYSFPLICMFFAVSAAGVISAAHSAPAPAVDCSSLVLRMTDCLPYVTEGGTATKPERTCCSGLKTVLNTNAQCLCEAFRNSAQLGITLNMTKALALPAACHVSAPAASNCTVSTSIGAAPALSPVAMSPSAVVGSPTSTIGASEGAPAPTPGNSGSTGLVVSTEFLVLTSVAALVYALL